MKTVIIIAERVTQSSVAAVVPASGVASVRVTRNHPGIRNNFAPGSYRSYRNPLRFTPAVRIELVVNDEAAQTVFDAVSFAHGAGFFSDAEIGIEPTALAVPA